MADTTVAQPARVPPAIDVEAHYEVVNGQRVETPRMGSYESHLANDLASYISEHFARVGRLGHVVVELLFRIDVATDLQRRPDLNRGQAIDEPTVPASQTQTWPRLRGHAHDALGVKEYWIIDRFRRTMTVFRREPPITGTDTVVTITESEIYQTDLLPGFELPLARLLAVADRWR
jgi:Uma2 family endonuclease